MAALFLDRFRSDAWQRLDPFLVRVGRTQMPFDLLAQTRKHEYPGYHGYEQGLPTLYYYFVPESGWGSESAPPSDPLDPAFVRSMDGFGLNFGCPLRLARALELLEQLPPEQQTDCRRGLASSTQHLATVEELIWLDTWREPSTTERILETTRKTYDWAIGFDDVTLRLECKFRPSDWPRLIDGSAHLPMVGALTGKAREQLGAAGAGELNVLAVTAVAPVSDAFRDFCRDELERARNIDALVYRRFVGETAVFALDAQVSSTIAQRIPPQPAQPFQPFYFMFTNRAEAARRQSQRQSESHTVSAVSEVKLHEIEIPSLPPRQVFQEPPLPYRCELRQRLPSGEPMFAHVPPYLPPTEPSDP